LVSVAAANSAGAQSINAVDPALADFIKQRQQQVEALKNGDGDQLTQMLESSRRTLQAPSLDARTAFGATPMSAPSANLGVDQVKGAQAIVYISLGMPDRELRLLFRDGVGRKDVVYLLRGTFDNDMAETRKRLFALVDTKDRRQQPNVFLLPQAFRNYHITQVPTVFVQDPHKKADWYAIKGAPSLELARKEVEDGRGNTTIGDTWPIAEEDIAERMRATAKGYDWDAWKHTLTADLAQKFTEGNPLPYALSDDSYLVDMGVTFPEDVKDKNGKVLIKAGTRINPLERTNVPGGAIMVIDPADARQIAMAQVWLKRWPAGIVMVTRYVPDGIGQLGVKVMMLDHLSTVRFHLQFVPSLLTAQDGQLLVKTYAPRVQGGIQ